MSTLLSVLIALIIGVSPFWLGSNRPLAWSGNAVAIGSLLVLTSMVLVIEARRYPPLKLSGLAGPFVLFGLVMVWAVVQVLPLGTLLAGHPAWGIASGVLTRDSSSTLSINPTETIWAITRWLTATAAFLAVYVLARDGRNAKVLLRTFLVLMSLAALYGLLRLSLSLDKILWFEEPDSGYLTSGFINRNSAATYFGMGSLAALGLVFHQVRKLLRPLGSASGRETIRSLVAALTGGLGFDLVLFVLLFVALLATGSRGGISFTVVAAVVLMLLYALRVSARRKTGIDGSVWVLIILIAIVLMLGVFEMSGARVMARLMDQGLESDARFETYARTFAAIQDYLIVGSGLGTFQDVFPAYRLDIAPGRQVWDKAHNDYLEIVLGLGVPAALMLVLSFLGLFLKALTGFFSRRRDVHFSAIAVAVCILVGLHSLVDFSLQIQANALALALFLGLGLAQSISSHV